ncbi:MAG: type II toxin-antitoxin system VapC family toxin, partial [Armatimonadetes bacterium]|nr:type II toxin-antitoxin system VapC family toxin [Armatimonadota bacterium]
GERLVTDVEVFQEILHRYSSIQRRDAIQPAFDALAAIAPETFPVEMTHLERAKDILLAMATVSARDAVHMAVMEHHGISRIMSFDAGFDQFPGISRIHSPD